MVAFHSANADGIYHRDIKVDNIGCLPAVEAVTRDKEKRMMSTRGTPGLSSHFDEKDLCDPYRQDVEQEVRNIDVFGQRMASAASVEYLKKYGDGVAALSDPQKGKMFKKELKKLLKRFLYPGMCERRTLEISPR